MDSEYIVLATNREGELEYYDHIEGALDDAEALSVLKHLQVAVKHRRFVVAKILEDQK